MMLESSMRRKRATVQEHPDTPFRRDAFRCLFYAFLINFLLESLARHNPVDALRFLVQHPLIFSYNGLLISCTFAIALLARRRTFTNSLLFTVWGVLGIINFSISSIRMTPLSFHDAVLFIHNLSITTAYLSFFEIILIILLTAALIALLVLLFMRAPTIRPRRTPAMHFLLSLCALTLSFSIPYAHYHQDYANPIEAYQRYGFAYSLLRSAVDRGISEPEEYNQDVVDDILAEVDENILDNSAIYNESDMPNIIFLQLESFYDPANIKTVQCSEDPIPTFSQLKETCSTGLLTVPSIGGGTANVEFEVLTGMRLNDFGTGEYPYTTVLQSRSCETVAHNLRNLGYQTHAIHNHMGTFYDRHLVYPQLGFDTFTPLEYMKNYTTNDLGWCCDNVLTNCILDALTQDNGRDMIFAISVQGHGNYTNEAPEVPYAISSSGLEDDENLKNEFEYYINTLHETDQFLTQLLQVLETFEEPVILIAYGDHLPALSFDESELVTNNHLVSEYIMWSNDDSLPKTDKSLYAFQLAAYALDRCGISAGVITRYHQQCADNPDYLEQLAVLEYDMLYGDQLQSEVDTPYPATSMRMGVKDITVTEATIHGDLMIVHGENFTKHSTVYTNDRALTTQYIDENTLIATFTLLSKAEADDMITIAQVSAEGTVLGHSNQIICKIALD